jgi:UDP-N-acetylmuramate dehydrogenase
MTRADVQRAAERIARAAGADVRLDEPIAPYLSMRVGGAVAALIAPQDADQVVAIVRALAAESVPHRLLGGGSNLIAEDDGLDFAVVQVGAASGPIRWDGDLARVQAGTTLAALLREALRQGRTGLEWAAGLPGTIGGAVAGNAGAFGGDIGRSVRAVRLLGADGRERTHDVRDGDFRYRHSFVRPGELVLEVTLELPQGEADAVRRETDRINRARAGSQPKGGHSSGCMFKNPPEAPAGRLIDECGLKGLRRGGARVSEAHANFVVNDGTASARDILELMDAVRAEVLARTGVTLESEVQVWRGTTPREEAP